MDDIAERWARDPETGKTYTVPGSMTYKQWAAKQTGLAKSVKPLEKSTKNGIMPTSTRYLQNKLSYEWKGKKFYTPKHKVFKNYDYSRQRQRRGYRRY